MLRTHELVVSSCLGWKLDPTGDPGDLSSGGWRSQGDELYSSVLEEIYLRYPLVITNIAIENGHI
jgi:hypothetical protein